MMPDPNEPELELHTATVVEKPKDPEADEAPEPKPDTGTTRA